MVATVVHKPGSEVEAWCTSCRADRMHRIIAVVSGKPKKVECLSCKGHHLYRPTQAQKDAAAAHKRASKGEGSSASTSKPRASRASITAPKRREEDLTATWEKAIAGQPFEAFKPYRIDRTFSKGELVRHNKFGDGVVSTILDANKCEVLFREGMKTLAQSIQPS